MISLGDTFWARDPNSNNPPHLYFAISDPCRNSGRVLLVNLTARRFGVDESCVLARGDHPCVQKESVIYYAKAIFPEAKMVEQAVYKGVFSPAASADAVLVCRVLEGALRSRHLRTEFVPIVEAELRELTQR